MHFARKRANLASIKLVSYLNGCMGCMCFYLFFYVCLDEHQEDNFTMIGTKEHKKHLYCEHVICTGWVQK